jgi:aerobic-type carbon monoxide dehydrogenase small subunit (CoxS/CutS family)
MKVLVQIEVDRAGCSVEVDPGTPLLELLWGTLHPTGTKEGYGQGKGDENNEVIPSPRSP